MTKLNTGHITNFVSYFAKSPQALASTTLDHFANDLELRIGKQTQTDKELE